MQERPLVALQSLENRQYVPTCGACFHFLGSCRQHLALLAEQSDRSDMTQAEAGAAGLREEAAVFPTALWAPLVPCAMGCGELYCSAVCRDAHWARGHRLLCVGPVPDSEAATHPLVLYKVHAMQSNEIFLLVADVVALILTRFEANGGDLAAAMLPFRDFVQRPWWEVATNPDPGSNPVVFRTMLEGLVQEAAQLLGQALLTRPGAPFAAHRGVVDPLFTPDFLAVVIGMFEQNNVGIQRPSPLPAFLATVLVPLCEVAATKGTGALPPQQVQYMGQVYLPLLAQVLDTWNDQENDNDDDEEEEEEGNQDKDEDEDEEHEAAMHVDHHHHHHHSGGGCCGGEDKKAGNGHQSNNPSHPFPNDTASALLSAASLSPRALLDTCLAKSQTSGIFSPLDGTSLLYLICCMNHSCRPNSEVRWVGGVGGPGHTPLLAELVAREPIPAGGELVQSYIRVEQTTVAERQEKLKEYGFVCHCPLCT